jgi:glycosyltransferase involved in cell wall biosynthesis
VNEQVPFVGVVTPVYNGEKYLAATIESVLAQTHESWRYIISDNRSTDRTREIAEDYAGRDERISVVAHDEHVHFLQSWNRAVRQLPAEADYCKVLCADDLLYPDCLEKMIGVVQRHPSVGLVGAYRLRGEHLSLDGLPAGEEAFDGRELCRRIFLGDHPYVFGSPSSTLVRADLARKRDPFYDETNLHADTGVCYDLLQESDFGFVHEVLTYTRLHDEAVTKYTTRVASYQPEHLRMLARYGPTFLRPTEYRRRLAVNTAEYAGMLLGILRRRPSTWRSAEFRDFHKQSFARLRKEVPFGDAARGVVDEIGHLAATTGRRD